MTTRRSPLAPTMGARGAYPGAVRYPSAHPENGTPVIKGHSKDASGDPSLGTASIRPSALERTGAAFRIRTEFAPVAAPNHPSSGATQANTVVVQDSQVPTPDKNWAAGTNGQFGQHVAISRDGESAPGLA